jgi:uncharacterized membrane protein
MAASKQAQSSNEDNVLAIVAYLTIIGWLIAFLLNREKNNTLVRFHEKQSLMLMIVGFVVSFIAWIPLIGWVAAIAVLVLWVMGLLNALNSKKEPLPIIGKYAIEHLKW